MSVTWEATPNQVTWTHDDTNVRWSTTVPVVRWTTDDDPTYVWEVQAGPVTVDGADLSDDTPQPPGTATAGVSNEAARADHVHPAELPADFTETDDIAIIDLFTGQPINLGTSGFSRLERLDIGPLSFIRLFFYVDADGDKAGMFAIILSAVPELPTPVMPPGGLATPGSFGAVRVNEANGTQVGVYACPPYLADVDPPNSVYAITFVVGGDTPFGFEATLGDGRPVSMAGRSVAYQGLIEYRRAGLGDLPTGLATLATSELTATTVDNAPGIDAGLPTDITPGDLLLAIVTYKADVGAAATWTPPTGWTLIGDSNLANGTLHTAVLARTAITAESDPVTFTADHAGATGQRQWTASVHRITNPTPFLDKITAEFAVIDADTTDHATPPVDTDADDTLVIAAATTERDGTHTVGAGLSEVGTIATAAGFAWTRSRQTVAEVNATGTGSFDPDDFTYAQSRPAVTVTVAVPGAPIT